jgi:tetratricopeptide (TPR) repeat protein
VTKEAQGQARFFWEKALALDPASASLNAELGLLHSFDARFGWWDDRETAIEKALAYVDRALEIDPGNADAYTASSLILLFQRQHDEAVAAARKAVELAPGAADTSELASHVLAASGYPEEAVVLSEKAMTLSPNYPAVYLGTLGNAYRLSGRTEQAIEAFQAYHARNPGFGLTDIVIAYQQTGRPEEARRTAEQLLAARPNFTVAAWLKTQFSHRDTAQVEATRLSALGADGLKRRIGLNIAVGSVLQKSFCTGDQKFCGLQARLSCKNVRGPHRLTLNSQATSVVRLRLYESAIASRFVFSRKIRRPATFDFCNTIGTFRTCQRTRPMSAYRGRPDLAREGRMSHFDPLHHLATISCCSSETSV